MKDAPRLIVQAYDPRRTWWLRVGVVSAWALSVVGVYVYNKSTMVPRFYATERELEATRDALREAERRLAELERQLAIAQRGEQVAKEAAQGLQAALTERDEELAGLRADLGFYQRLAGGSAQQPGLSVHSISIEATADPRLFRYTLALSQNIKKGRVTSGSVLLSVKGKHDGQLTALGLRDLGGTEAPERLPFSFKYFQTLEGSLLLPPGFEPTAVRVALDPDDGGAPVEREFPWDKALLGGSGSG